jgi:hypothetical protein
MQEHTQRSYSEREEHTTTLILLKQGAEIGGWTLTTALDSEMVGARWAPALRHKAVGCPVDLMVELSDAAAWV